MFDQVSRASQLPPSYAYASKIVRRSVPKRTVSAMQSCLIRTSGNHVCVTTVPNSTTVHTHDSPVRAVKIIDIAVPHQVMADKMLRWLKNCTKMLVHLEAVFIIQTFPVFLHFPVFSGQKHQMCIYVNSLLSVLLELYTRKLI